MTHLALVLFQIKYNDPDSTWDVQGTKTLKGVALGINVLHW